VPWLIHELLQLYSFSWRLPTHAFMNNVNSVHVKSTTYQSVWLDCGPLRHLPLPCQSSAWQPKLLQDGVSLIISYLLCLVRSWDSTINVGGTILPPKVRQLLQ